jgi:hypothetical protein
LLKSWTGLDWGGKTRKERNEGKEKIKIGEGGFSLVGCPAVVSSYVENLAWVEGRCVS